ncbi:MAG: type VI secretion system contractile sheath small subunit [Actinomycetota bacterium]|nr:type VI secretion system contractile sheath small subunit [Actinomycetota bacterium]
MTKCSGITRAGTACKGIPVDGSEWCFVHHPDYTEERRRYGSRGGKRGGRGRPQAELTDIKDCLRAMVEDVRNGDMDRADAAVCGQLYNTLIRAVLVELKVREVEDLARQVEELSELLDARNNGGRRWG